MQLQAPSVLLLGGTGTGKTWSLATLAPHTKKLFVVVTEPNGLETLLNSYEEHKLPLDNLHWATIMPTRQGFDTLARMAKNVATLDFLGLANLKPQGKRNEAQWFKMLETFVDFKCERTGQSFGAITDFTPEYAFAIDSLSGLNVMAMDITIGDKPSAHQGEWGIAMNLLEKLLYNLTSNLMCPFVLTAHLERETNEITGGSTISASTLGRKLAPKLPRFFSEVVLAYKEGGKFLWSTNHPGVDLKNRSLLLDTKLQPDFGPVIVAYQNRVQRIAESKVVQRPVPMAETHKPSTLGIRPIIR